MRRRGNKRSRTRSMRVEGETSMVRGKYMDTRRWEPQDDGYILQCHDSSLAGHGGTAKLSKLVSRQYYWPKMREMIKWYVKNYDTCQQSKAVQHVPYRLLQPNEVPDQSWRSIAMDFITDLPKSDGNDMILVVIDHLTKMSYFIYTMEKRAGCTAIGDALHAEHFRTSWDSTRYHHQQRKLVHLSIMETNYGKIRNWTKIEESIPPTKRPSKRGNQRDTGTISVYIYQLLAGQLERTPTIGGVCIQQRISGNDQDDSILRQLRKKPPTSSDEPHDYRKWNFGRIYEKSSSNIMRWKDNSAMKTKRKLQ